jgi:hypothetical protein
MNHTWRNNTSLQSASPHALYVWQDQNWWFNKLNIPIHATSLEIEKIREILYRWLHRPADRYKGESV